MRSAPTNSITVCSECDLVCAWAPVGRGEVGRCPRCDNPFHPAPPESAQTALALAFTGGVLVVILNAFPLLALKLHATQRETTLIQAALEMWHHDMRLVGMLVLLTTVIAPAAQVVIHLHVLWQLQMGRGWATLRAPLRWLYQLRPWSMGEVFLLGLLVSLVKLQHVADIVLGPAFWACLGLIFITAALNATVDAHSVWVWHERRHLTGVAPSVCSSAVARTIDGPNPLTGQHLGITPCHVCGAQCPLPALPDIPADSCERCGSPVHARRPDSLSRTTALLIAAAVLYIPANVLPVMHTQSILGAQNDTILSGVLLLLRTGSWPLALVVFVASVVVPLLKLFALGLLVWTTARRSTWAPSQRHRLYRLVEIIGRWSMLDVYVITVLVGLVQFRTLAGVLPGSGALAFAAVVVLTMFAAKSFDPRLIWDHATVPAENLQKSIPPSFAREPNEHE